MIPAKVSQIGNASGTRVAIHAARFSDPAQAHSVADQFRICEYYIMNKQFFSFVAVQPGDLFPWNTGEYIGREVNLDNSNPLTTKFMVKGNPVSEEWEFLRPVSMQSSRVIQEISAEMGISAASGLPDIINWVREVKVAMRVAQQALNAARVNRGTGLESDPVHQETPDAVLTDC